MVSRSKTQTQKLAAKLSKTILLRPRKNVGATIIALQGELGAGKTTFVQGFMKALGVKQRITSPTFLIIRKYALKSQRSNVPGRTGKGQMFSNIYHLDLYRIYKAKELLDLGFKKIIADPKNIVLIEWPERVKKLLPKKIIKITFAHGKKVNERIMVVK